MTAVTAGKIIGRGDIVMGADETAQGRSDKVGKPATDTIPGARNAVAGAVFRTADDKSTPIWPPMAPPASKNREV